MTALDASPTLPPRLALSFPEAVADLQRRHGLPPTGALDARTERACRRELAWRALEERQEDA
jgi:hypothetical protein